MSRSREERLIDVRALLASAVDVWVATASPSGVPHLVPLSFAAVGTELIVCATPASSVTARNAEATRRARLGFGDLRDVVMVDATASAVPWSSAEPRLVDEYISSRGWDPLGEPFDFAMLMLRPVRVQAWRSLEEIAGRDLMQHGTWIDEPATER
jgi:predicted pyridoxine 5'-phosphate oxidase superfamily flavin-nucleotide-binding protein